MKGNNNVLLDKLQRFIRKYYLNRLLKGALVSFTLIIAFYLTVTLLEYLGRFDTNTRMFLLFSFLTFLIGILWYYIVLPISKLFMIGKTLSNEQAAEIIGNHFGSVKDKLTNTLELHRLATTSEAQNALILASIEQREKELNPIPFASAIDLSKNRRYIKYAVIPVSIMLLILVFSPSILTESTNRIVQYNTQFVEPAPFDFVLKNQDLNVIQFDNYKIEVELKGKQIPNACHIQFGSGTRLKMTKKEKGVFEYVIRNIDRTQKFKFSALSFNSKEYEVRVLSKPIFTGLKLEANFPKYLKKENEEYDNVSSLALEDGTDLSMDLKTQNVNAVWFTYNADTLDVKLGSAANYFSNLKIRKDGILKIWSKNNSGISGDSAQIKIKVIKDQFPAIQVIESKDSMSSKLVYFKGLIRDDHGCSKLNFVYSFEGKDKRILPIKIPLGTSAYDFFYSWNLYEIDDSLLKPGSKMEYFFEVWDNDQINQPKYTRSHTMEYAIPSKQEIKERTKKENQKIKKDLEANIEEAKLLQKEIDKLNRKLMEKKNISWEEKRDLERLLQKQKNLKSNFERIKQENKVNNFKQSEFTPEDQRILEKQKQLEELMEKVMDEKTQKLLEELKKLMEQNNKNQLQEKLDELKLDSKDVEKELDRSLELFKQLEFEKQLKDAIEEINDLKDQQEKLNKETNASDKKESNEELKEQQDKLKKALKELNKNLDDLKDKNESLERKNELPDLKEEQKNTEQQMQNASDQLQQGKKKDAGKSQQNAKKELEKMEQKLSNFQKKMEQEQQSEDIEALRRLRQNLMRLSFNQEDLIKDVRTTAPRDPLYVTHTKRQKALSDNAKMIEDSLFALSKRNLKIQSMVNREIAAINDHIHKSIRSMEQRNSPVVMKHQQFVMTSINNLALMLDESIQQSQKEMSSKKFGSKSCSKPGAVMPKMGDLKKLQKQLSDQLKKMREQQAKNPGNKPGKKPGGKMGRGSKMSEKMAKMAAQQAAIRSELRKMQEELDKAGKSGGGSKQLKKLDELMEKNEEDLVNMKIDRETIQRQEQIMSRLLESEKAERERELDKKRESKEGINKFDEQPDFIKYQLKKQKQVELLEIIPPNLKPFYRNLVNDYYNSL